MSGWIRALSLCMLIIGIWRLTWLPDARFDITEAAGAAAVAAERLLHVALAGTFTLLGAIGLAGLSICQRLERAPPDAPSTQPPATQSPA
jgi:hypothetical protein